MKRITIKLASFFIVLICISSALSFLVSTLYTNDIEREIRFNQEEIATAILDITIKTDLSVEETIKTMPTSIYNITILGEHDLDLTDEQWEMLQNGHLIFTSRGGFSDPTTLTMVDSTLIQVSLYPQNTIFKIVASRIWFSTLLYVLIGICLILLLVRRIVKPILRLNTATKEVAKGNFDIEISSNSRDEIGQLTHNFNKMTRELKNIEYLRKDFITSVSHEFKTPIASIQGFAKLLQKGNLTDEERQEYTGIIVEETTRLSNLSSNILRLSKLENQEIIERKGFFLLDEQIRKSILVLEHHWSEKEIEFDINLDKVEYLGDEELLQQVWINLLGNAIKFSKKNEMIKVSLRKVGEGVEVKIIDQGIGMTEEIKQRIFEKFYQGDRAHSHEGNGLGLPLVKRIIDLYGGSIGVESQTEKGSTFTVYLPFNY